MTHRGFMTRTRIIAGLLTGLLCALPAAPLHGQAAGESRLFYDVRQEVTLTGTVSAVLVKPAAGMIMGSHLLLATVSGQVDASLGRWAMQGDSALSVRSGQQIEITGVMQTAIDKQVFMVRTVNVGGTLYKIRDERGFPIATRDHPAATTKEEAQ